MNYKLRSTEENYGIDKIVPPNHSLAPFLVIRNL